MGVFGNHRQIDKRRSQQIILFIGGLFYDFGRSKQLLFELLVDLLELI